MQRVTITIDDDLLDTVDGLMTRHGYKSRSEALREIIRAYSARSSLSDPGAQCIAALTLVFDRGTRELAKRVNDAHHARHNMIIASTQVYLDHDSCLEVSVQRGEVGEVKAFAESLSAQRGVHHANLHLIPIEVEETKHDHGSGAKKHDHLHV
jgi:CopG family nickel-responsive transcriptional regulator